MTEEYPNDIEQASWEGKQVALLLPFYKTTTPLTHFSILGLYDRAKMVIMQKHGDAFIVHTRNSLANRFVQSGIPWSFWADDDMVFPFGDPEWFLRETGFKMPVEFAKIHILNRLLSHGKTLVGGLYFGRNRDMKPMYSEGITDPIERAIAHSAPRNAVKPVTWVATGGLLVHRSVYLDIQAKFPTLAPQTADAGWAYFSNSETSLVGATEEAIRVLKDVRISESARIAEADKILTKTKELLRRQRSNDQGEDVTFCRRALAAGHQPYVDLGAVCGHIGPYVYGPKACLS